MLDQYIKELEEDLKIDDLDLKNYTMKLPGIKHKWAGRCIRHKIELNDLKIEKEKRKKQLIKQINETSSVKLSAPAIEKVIDDSDDTRQINRKIKDLELIIELLEKAEKTLASASYDIKNLIEIIKLETT